MVTDAAQEEWFEIPNFLTRKDVSIVQHPTGSYPRIYCFKDKPTVTFIYDGREGRIKTGKMFRLTKSCDWTDELDEFSERGVTHGD